MEVLESLFARALKLESLWKITRIEFGEKEGRITILVDREPHPRIGTLRGRPNLSLLGEGTNRHPLREGANRLLIGEGISRPPNRGTIGG